MSEQLPEHFAMMKGDFDEERRKKLDRMSKAEKERLEQQQLYLEYLYQAQGMDLSDIARMNVIFESGKDSLGRPVVVIIGYQLPTLRSLLDRVFMYMIRIMDKIANNNYVVVYVHTNMEDKGTPEFAWMKRVYNIMDSKYGNHLSAFYVVHPTFWLRVTEGVLSSFMKNDNFWKKVRYIEKLDEIFNNIEHDQLVLPEEVFQYDTKMNGPRPVVSGRRNFSAEGAGAIDNL